ncbi:uncharacterized protein MONBRDRAFT_22399 [Monosiga brevicollis MX1]|uniref:Uncharacterized protein n=1 Tax=Monosiga brevicollis TaxID=81824 RepID=A9UQG7_MONBE|nr:uncharacterized protein MONBRDRAFT_22399 [Monosiga brevicollis MX1]EDQ93042.1 predicted protein [Monosiga brevicollis MX1]|eukprot:XP_001742804.1 hypothetical protein [Monosiga brevicollis MX1]
MPNQAERRRRHVQRQRLRRFHRRETVRDVAYYRQPEQAAAPGLSKVLQTALMNMAERTRQRMVSSTAAVADSVIVASRQVVAHSQQRLAQFGEDALDYMFPHRVAMRELRTELQEARERLHHACRLASKLEHEREHLQQHSASPKPTVVERSTKPTTASVALSPIPLSSPTKPRVRTTTVACSPLAPARCANQTQLVPRKSKAHKAEKLPPRSKRWAGTWWWYDDKPSTSKSEPSVSVATTSASSAVVAPSVPARALSAAVADSALAPTSDPAVLKPQPATNMLGIFGSPAALPPLTSAAVPTAPPPPPPMPMPMPKAMQQNAQQAGPPMPPPPPPPMPTAGLNGAPRGPVGSHPAPRSSTMITASALRAANLRRASPLKRVNSPQKSNGISLSAIKGVALRKMRQNLRRITTDRSPGGTPKRQKPEETGMGLTEPMFHLFVRSPKAQSHVLRKFEERHKRQTSFVCPE